MNHKAEAAEQMYDIIWAFYDALRGKPFTEKSGTLAMVVAAWLAAYPEDEREKALNHHLEVVRLVLPDVATIFAKRHFDA